MKRTGFSGFSISSVSTALKISGGHTFSRTELDEELVDFMRLEIPERDDDCAQTDDSLVEGGLMLRRLIGGAGHAIFGAVERPSSGKLTLVFLIDTPKDTRGPRGRKSDLRVPHGVDA